jgi:hypothetical protein
MLCCTVVQCVWCCVAVLWCRCRVCVCVRSVRGPAVVWGFASPRGVLEGSPVSVNAECRWTPPACGPGSVTAWCGSRSGPSTARWASLAVSAPACHRVGGHLACGARAENEKGCRHTSPPPLPPRATAPGWTLFWTGTLPLAGTWCDDVGAKVPIFGAGSPGMTRAPKITQVWPWPRVCVGVWNRWWTLRRTTAPTPCLRW